MSEPAEPAHVIRRAIGRYAGISTLRAACGCGGFSHDTPRFSAPGRRKQERLIAEHLAGVAADPVHARLEAAAMLTRLAIEVAP